MKLKIMQIALLLTVPQLSSCTGTEQAEEGRLIFQSGFEPDCELVQTGESGADIVGLDRSLATRNDWDAHMDGDAELGGFSIQYQDGDLGKRYADIVPEPGRPDNHVLKYWLQGTGRKNWRGRIQANMYHTAGWKEFYQSVRVYLHEDFSILRTYPDHFTWLTLAELWNNPTWGADVNYPFRVTLGIAKFEKGEGDLRFRAHGQDATVSEDGKKRYTKIWEEKSEVLVPIGKWFTLEYYFLEGDESTGRFYVAITPEGEERRVVFDLQRITHNTSDPSPDGLTHYNPLKLYTAGSLLRYMQQNDSTMQIYWDDFKLWKDKRPER